MGFKTTVGELDLRGARENKIVVEQHTAMNIPWIQAKLMIYYLKVQVAIYEQQHGPIRIPTSVLPPEPPPLPGQFKDNPVAESVRALVLKMRAEYLASLNV